MKIVFMGTPEFAVPALNKLVEHHEVVAVISQPDKPKGRKKSIQPTPVKEAALGYNIPVYQPVRIKDPDFIKVLRSIEADVFVVVAYGQILSKEILYMAKYGCLNIHGSLLPKYRGPAPVHWAVMNGDKKTGVTIMYMNEGVDTGDMILSKEKVIEERHTSGILYEELSYLGAEALIEALNKIDKGCCERTVQDDSEACYAPLLTKELGHIDWSKSTQCIINLIKGLDPWPSAYTYLVEDCMMKIWKAEECCEYFEGEPGQIVKADPKKGIYVKTGDGTLIIKELQMPRKKRMDAGDFLRGHKLESGKILK